MFRYPITSSIIDTLCGSKHHSCSTRHATHNRVVERSIISARSTQDAAHYTQHAAHNTQHAAHSTQDTGRSTQHAARSTHCLTSGAALLFVTFDVVTLANMAHPC